MVRIIEKLRCWVFVFLILWSEVWLVSLAVGRETVGIRLLLLTAAIGAALAAVGAWGVRRALGAVRPDPGKLPPETARAWKKAGALSERNLLLRIARPRIYRICSEEPDAFASGLRTVIVTEGFSGLPWEEQEKILSREIKYLARGYGMLQLLSWFHFKLLTYLWFLIKLLFLGVCIMIAFFLERGRGVISVVRSVRVGRRPEDLAGQVNRWSIRIPQLLNSPRRR